VRRSVRQLQRDSAAPPRMGTPAEQRALAHCPSGFFKRRARRCRGHCRRRAGWAACAACAARRRQQHFSRTAEAQRAAAPQPCSDIASLSVAERTPAGRADLSGTHTTSGREIGDNRSGGWERQGWEGQEGGPATEAGRRHFEGCRRRTFVVALLWSATELGGRQHRS
jgi:hypothetical protein